MRHLLQTGQRACYNSKGVEVPCAGSGQDGEYRIGEPWPENRFEVQGEAVRDNLTGLQWTGNANIGGFPVSWQEALEQIKVLNKDGYGGFGDWRLPDRRELRSLMSYQTRKPSLPVDHPFRNVFLGWYWTSTSAAIHPDYAWSVHLEGARMFYGQKDQYYLFWPVRGTGNGLLPATGADRCLDESGQEIPCPGSGQDGELQSGSPWPQLRFAVQGALVTDKLTDLVWARGANVTQQAVTWDEALQAIRELNREGYGGVSNWRLPNINELESLVDCRSHSPALSIGHPFEETQEGYWSSTTSFFETDWAWVLYLHKGACGVGYKPGKTFYVWPVTSLPEP
ncbi:MAG: DUF1566 domain-containing protein [Desulfocapsaceae bacterium]|nr:DUF1566 domain-containing protein [Desulfocapsaceae bacterium]